MNNYFFLLYLKKYNLTEILQKCYNPVFYKKCDRVKVGLAKRFFYYMNLNYQFLTIDVLRFLNNNFDTGGVIYNYIDTKCISFNIILFISTNRFFHNELILKSIICTRSFVFLKTFLQYYNFDPNLLSQYLYQYNFDPVLINLLFDVDYDNTDTFSEFSYNSFEQVGMICKKNSIIIPVRNDSLVSNYITNNYITTKNDSLTSNYCITLETLLDL
jgi:hypothetical protein